MNTLVICRLADPDLRKKVFARLKNRGFYLSQGVFECEFGPTEFARLREYLRELPYGANDHIMLYSLCSACQKKRLAFGSGCVEASADSGWVII